MPEDMFLWNVVKQENFKYKLNTLTVLDTPDSVIKLCC